MKNGLNEWVTVGQIEDLPPGRGMEIVSRGQVLAIFNIEGTVYAMDGVCPHAGGPVGTGDVEGCIVTCPWHGWQFDVTTGGHTLNPTLFHPTFPARVSGAEIQVQLEAQNP